VPRYLLPSLLACLLAAGCAVIGAPGGDTSVVIPLESGAYVLTQAAFRFTGPADVAVTAEPTEAAVVVDLEPGVYQVELEPGWQLERVLADGTRHPVDAVLAGPAVQDIAVVPGTASEVRFEFLVTSPPP
jgi:hypothetical protein